MGVVSTERRLTEPGDSENVSSPARGRETARPDRMNANVPPSGCQEAPVKTPAGRPIIRAHDEEDG
jgi:hypothetical protein